MSERLQKLMAQAGLGSRRDNESVIAAGRVRVNGKIARLGDKADPARDVIEVDGARLSLKGKTPVYILLNKPRNVLSSLEDELAANRQTVRDLINEPGHLYPVGRLDRESEGLMLMTNDGDMAHKLTHPRYAHEKVYRVTVEGNPSAASLDRWRQGVLLDGRPTLPVTIDVVQQKREFTLLRLVMREGRKRQIRRIAAMLGHPVRQLVREQIGPLQLGSLKPGEWRHLTAAEVRALQQNVKGKPARKPPLRTAGKPPTRSAGKAAAKPVGQPPKGARPRSENAGRSGSRGRPKGKR